MNDIYETIEEHITTYEGGELDSSLMCVNIPVGHVCAPYIVTHKNDKDFLVGVDSVLREYAAVCVDEKLEIVMDDEYITIYSQHWESEEEYTTETNYWNSENEFQRVWW